MPTREAVQRAVDEITDMLIGSEQRLPLAELNVRGGETRRHIKVLLNTSALALAQQPATDEEIAAANAYGGIDVPAELWAEGFAAGAASRLLLPPGEQATASNEPIKGDKLWASRK